MINTKDYVLPVKKPFRIEQGFNSQFTHKNFPDLGVDDSFALDFIVDENTPIYAARSGNIQKIMKDSDFNYPGTDESLGGEAAKATNYILIEHDDGTLANYMHLRKGGIATTQDKDTKERPLQEGDYVEAGQLIGYSGDTGWSTAPHLHFSVYKEIDECWRKTLEIKFNDYDGSLEDCVLNPE